MPRDNMGTDELIDFAMSSPDITDDRKNHMRGVSKSMRSLAMQLGWDEDATAGAEALGLLHDIGYAFAATDPRRHEESGGDFLRDNGYAHWQEVRWHGLTRDERPYDSQLLLMLNHCDMTTGPDGCPMTIDERVTDIADRYGTDSPVTLRAMEMQKEIADAF